MTYKLPEGWIEVKLDTLVDIRGGKRMPKGKILTKDITPHPYIRVADFSNNHNFELNNKFEYVPTDIYEQIKNYTVNKNDIIVSIVGTIGNIAKIGDTLDSANLTENCARIYEYKDNIHGDYLYYYLISPIAKNLIYSATVGAVQSKLPLKNIRKLDIILPPLPEQKEIADTLSALDNKIENNNKTNENLEEQAQTIFKHWFIDFEFPDKNSNPYKSSGGEMVESELGMIPKGWEPIKLGDIIKISNGKRPPIKYEEKSLESLYPILGASGIMGYTNEFLYDKPILAIGRVGTHGVVQKANNKVWTSDNTMVITSDHYEFVNIVLLNIDYRSLNRGTTQPLLVQKDIKGHPLVFPDKETIEHFESIIKEFNKLININQKQNQKLIKLRDIILPKLMSGEIRLPLD